MRKKRSFLLTGVAVACALGVSGCDIFSSGVGACVSEPVEYTFGLRVYCYSEWDKTECTENDELNVNGASWTFYSGQSCEDRDLTDGSNPWP